MRWTANHITYVFDEKKCTCGLGLCVEACGQGALGYEEGSEKMEIVDTLQCIFCRQCEEVCPTRAISIEGALTIQDVKGV